MKSLAVVALALILAPAALAQHQTFGVNPDASDVKMKLNTTHEVVLHHLRHIAIAGPELAVPANTHQDDLNRKILRKVVARFFTP